SLLRQQFQDFGSAEVVVVAARTGESIQERHAGGNRFSAAANSASIRGRAVSAAKRKKCRKGHGAREGVDGRLHATHRARAVRAGAYAGGSGGAARDFSGTRRADGADRRYFEDGARREARCTGGGRDRAQVRTISAGIYGGVPEN